MIYGILLDDADKLRRMTFGAGGYVTRFGKSESFTASRTAQRARSADFAGVIESWTLRT